MLIWSVITILAVLLLTLHAVYLRRDYLSLKQYWQELDQTLSDRQKILQEIFNSLPNQAGIIVKDLHNLAHYSADSHPRRWRQRAALESRLSLQVGRALSETAIDKKTVLQLNRLDNAIQLSLRLYQISAHRYNQRRESFPGNILAIFGGMPVAPDFEIDTIEINNKD